MPANALVVGATQNAPGSMPVPRGLYTGETGVADVHGRYQEAVSRGSVFSLVFAAAALAVASATAAGAFVLNNPIGSGKNLAILDIQNTMTANTPVATGTALVLGALINPVFSALGTAVVPTQNLVGSAKASVAAGYPSGTYAVLPSVTPPGLRFIGGYYADLAASALNAYSRDEVAGEVIVQPGNAVNVYGLGGTPADITATIVITWEEISINT
jgi:hypothetical protein